MSIRHMVITAALTGRLVYTSRLRKMHAAAAMLIITLMMLMMFSLRRATLRY